jgi:DNA-binding transcriptional ArsR family regulator
MWYIYDMDTKMFATLAEPNRLHIIELLHKSPRSVNDIAHALHLSQPQVSKHLKVLADAGIVKVSPLKNKRVYSLKPEAFKALDTWLQNYRDVWEERLDRLDTFLNKEMNKL